MNKKTIALSFAAAIAATLVAGCIPENLLQWSQDGSVGLMQVQGALYLVNGQNGRLFFSSIKLALPLSNFDDARWSLFCYDPAAKSIVDVLPASISETLGQITIDSFSLSPDGSKVLLPMKKNRFAIYDLDKSAACIPINETESFGEEETLTLAPAWKSNTDISCLVSGTSHFLQEEKSKTPAVVIIDTDNRLRNILSENWPPAVMGSFN